MPTKSYFAPECTPRLTAIGWASQPVNGSMTPCTPYYMKLFLLEALPSETFVLPMDHRDTFRKCIRYTRRQDCHVRMGVQPSSRACKVSAAHFIVRPAKRDGNLSFGSLSQPQTSATISI